MGERGPVGKRSDQRLGHRAKAEADSVTKVPAGVAVEAPEADPEWHPAARRWFDSLSLSGQAQFYEPSDWATAYIVAESMTRDLNPQFVGFAQTSRETTEAEFTKIPLKGASLAAYLKAFSSLLVTEGDRRRAQVELQRGPAVDEDDEAAESATNVYRAKFA